MKLFLPAAVCVILLVGCASNSDTVENSNSDTIEDSNDSASTEIPIDCAADPSTVNTVAEAFIYEDIAGADLFWVGDDDEAGLNPLRLKMGIDCVLRANPGYDDFGDSPTIVAQWQYTTDGAIRILDWDDQFSLIQTTSVAHEICWASFNTCEGEGKFRSEGGIRRLFFNETDAKAYFDNL